VLPRKADACPCLHGSDALSRQTPKFSPLEESRRTHADHPNHPAASNRVCDQPENRPRAFVRVDSRPDAVPDCGSVPSALHVSKVPMASDRMKTSCRLPVPTGAPTSFSFAPLAKPHVVPQGVHDRGAGCRGRYRLPWGRLIFYLDDHVDAQQAPLDQSVAKVARVAGGSRLKKARSLANLNLLGNGASSVTCSRVGCARKSSRGRG